MEQYLTASGKKFSGTIFKHIELDLTSSDCNTVTSFQNLAFFIAYDEIKEIYKDIKESFIGTRSDLPMYKSHVLQFIPKDIKSVPFEP